MPCAPVSCQSVATFRPAARGRAAGVWTDTARLSDFLYLSFVFIDVLALFPRFLHSLALLRVSDQTSSAALFPGERVARVASQVRGFFPLSLATSEFGFSSRPRHLKLGSFFSSFWVRFPSATCVFNNILASFVLILCFFGVVSPGPLAKFQGREIDESGSPGMAHSLPKPQPERLGRRLASQPLDSLTPRLLDCTWRQKPQAGTTDENRRGLSGITDPAGPDPRPNPTKEA